MTTSKPISVDDHVVEPAHVFVDHIDPKFRDRAPRIVERDGAEGWLWEDRFYPLLFQGNADDAEVPRGRGGTRRRPLRPALRGHDPGRVRRARARPARWTKTACGRSCCSRRSRASAAPSSSQAEDKDLALAMVRAWNDWMLDEWCAAYPERFIPQTLDPAVGRAGRGRRDRAVRGQGLARGALRREPAPARAAVVPDRALAPGVRGVQRRPGCRCRCTSARRSGLHPAVARDDAVGRHRAVRHQLDERARRPDLQRHVQRLAELPGRAVGRRRGLGAVRARAARLHVGAQPLRGPGERRRRRRRCSPSTSGCA